MSLRVRLTLLNMFLVGGILLLFGPAIYLAMSSMLTNQIDNALAKAANQIFGFIRVTQSGELGLDTLPDLDISTEVVVQIWGRDSRLRFESPNIFGLNRALDARGLGVSQPVYNDTLVNNIRFRVLTVPLTIANSNRLVGTLQVGANMSVIDSTQKSLVVMLLTGSIIAMAMSGLVGWFSISQSLKPLNLVTQTALQITRADDLSRRISYQGPPGDEVGQLITAFNQTLSRMENLFNSQRRFLADVGHELRTPLTVIKGNVDLMRRMDCSDDESLVSIENEVDRLTRMVGDLLLLAQAESGKIPLARRTVELDTLVFEVLQQMRVLAHDKMTLKIGEIDQVLVCGDYDRLKQVLMNLIGNAIKYTPTGGEVVVGVGKVDNRARLTISDNGPGIPPEDRPYIFERFYRGEKARTRSRDGKGYGLGLSIAYWIVRNHGGQIEVGENQPQGTIFCVWLPLSDGKCPDESL